MDNSMKNFTLSRNTFGQLCLQIEGGQFYEQVLPVKAFPISLPGECIAIVDAELGVKLGARSEEKSEVSNG